MRFKGISFRRAPSVVRIPFESRTDTHDQDSAYVRFGRVVREGTPGAVVAFYGRNPAGERVPIYAKQVKPDGWSRTDMMYGADGKVYVMKDGACYTAPLRKRS